MKFSVGSNLSGIFRSTEIPCHHFDRIACYIFLVLVQVSGRVLNVKCSGLILLVEQSNGINDLLSVS